MKTKLLLTILTLCSGLSLLGQIPNYIPQNGLVAWYPFNGNANDESGNGNNASTIQAQLSSDRFNQNNKSFSFNGATDFIEIPNSSSFEFNNSISISAWINVAQLFQSGGAGFFPIISKSNQQFVYGTFAFGIWSPNLLAHFKTQETGAPLQISFNEWQHVIVIISNGETKFYNNGNLIFSGPSGAFPNQYNSNLPIRIGNDRPGLVEYANGKIDDIGIWNRALSPQEITSLYTGQAPCQNTSSVNSASITQGETYSFNGQNLTTAGTYTATLQNAAGCDSLVTLNLTVLLGNNCFATPDGIDNNNGAYPVGWSYKDFVIPVGSRLDSIYMSATRPGFPEIYYDLTISRNENGQIFSLFNYDNYNASMYNTWFNTVSLNLSNQVVRIAIPTNAGAIWNYLCFSISTVCENNAFSFDFSITEGETYSFNGQNLTTTGTYTATLQNIAGCDSLVTLNLTIEPVVEPLICGISASETSVCAGESSNLILEGSSANGVCAAGNLPTNLQNGLVAYYPFCGNANDESGNGNNGVVNGAELSQDRFGNTQGAFQFNGTSDYIEIPNSEELNFSNQYSISVWVKIPDYSINSGSERSRTMISKPRSSGGTGYAFRSIEGFAFNGQNPSTYTSGWNNSIVNATIGGNQDVLPLNTWSHIVFTFSGSEVKLYRDGLLINSRMTSFVLNNSQTSLFLGKEFAFNNQFSRWFKGTIDEVALYNRALTIEDIQALHSLHSLDILWSTGETTPSISVSPTETTTYSVTVTQGTQTCTSDVTITVNQATSSTINASITEGESYNFNGQNLTTAGTYTATLQNAAGCDSLVTLSLNVLPSLVCNIDFSSTSICNGDALELSIQYNDSQGSNGAGSISSQGLVASYMYNANTLDNSGNGNNAENIGCSLTNDRLGNPNSAYYFNGGSNMISNLENSPVALSPSAITISAWINVYAFDPTYNFVPIASLNDGSNRIFEFFVEPNMIGFWSTNIYSGVNFNGVGSGWKQVAVTFDNGFISYYFNGELVGVNQTGQNNLILHPNCNLEIGRDTPGLTEFYNGNLDELNIWNRALSANEISSLYGAQFPQISWSTGETTPSISVSPTETTTYSVTLTQGTQTCTSDVTITVNQPTSSTINASITEGESYNFNGQNLTTAGTYTATLQNAAGCDSVVTLKLTVNPAPVAGCYASSVVNFNQGPSVLGSAVSSIRSNANQALGQPEAVVTNVVNFVSLGFGGTITVAFETPIANGVGNDIRLDEATWGNNPCSRYPEKADVFASQDGTNFIYLGQACQDASFDLGSMSWAKYIRLVDVSDILSFNADADGFDLNGIECLNGSATNPSNDGLEACTLQEIVSYAPGNRKNGTAVPSPRNNATNALGMPQSNNTVNFVALGFGGTLVAKFDYVVFNQPGNDLQVTETSFGNPSCTNYPEKARVSLSLDNQNWVELGEICQDGVIDMGTMPYAQYIRIQDATPISSSKFNGSADGYDVDAVVVLNNGCGTSSARLSQLDNTTTPDEALIISAFPNPMEDYTIVNFEGLESDSDFNFQIMDAAGRLVRNENIRVSVNNPTYMFDASELARGIYQVVLSNEKGNQIIRLVK